MERRGPMTGPCGIPLPQTLSHSVSSSSDSSHILQTDRLGATLHPPFFEGREQDVLTLGGVFLSLQGRLSQWVVYFKTRLVSAGCFVRGEFQTKVSLLKTTGWSYFFCCEDKGSEVSRKLNVVGFIKRSSKYNTAFCDNTWSAILNWVETPLMILPQLLLVYTNYLYVFVFV